MIQTAIMLAVAILAGDGATCPSAPPAIYGSYGSELTLAGDLDGDGDDDLAIPTFEGPIEILLNDGDGTFAVATAYGGERNTADMEIGDLDDDGDLDLVVSAWNAPEVTIFRNAGDGTFGISTAHPMGGVSSDVEIGDLNGDGLPDVVAALAYTTTIELLPNDGSGGFGAALPIEVGDRPRRIAAGDLDGDTDLDLVTWSSVSDSLTVWLNDGAAAFTLHASFFTSYGATFLERGTLSDMDGDGDLDLVLLANDLVLVRANDGAAGFDEVVASWLGDGMYFGFTTDIDGDADPDVVARESQHLGFYVFVNDGTGALGQSPIYGGLSSRAAGDFDGDGSTDLLLGVLPGVMPLLNNGDGSFPGPVHYPVGRGAQHVSVADLNDDGHRDLVVCNAIPSDYFGDDEGTTGTVSLLLNNGAGIMTALAELDVGYNPLHAEVAHLDGDGELDLVVVNDDNISVLMGLGEGNFGLQTMYADVAIGVVAADTSDFDGDGALDVVMTNRTSDDVVIVLGNGDGSFADPIPVLTGVESYGVVATDMDGDGAADIAATVVTGEVHVLINDGTGAYPSVDSYGAGLDPRSITAGDFDGDGAPDLAVTNDDSDDVTLLVNDGDGTFPQSASYPVGERPLSVTAADVDGDGDLDLLVGSPRYPLLVNSLSVLLNVGDGTFGAALMQDYGWLPTSIAAADLDGDGDLDLAMSQDDSVSVLLVTCDAACAGDLDASGVVDFADVLAIIGAWGPCVACPEDLNGSGDVGFGDLFVLFINWGPCDQ